MKRERTSYAFLMEMIWVCAFFLICASIFVMAFAKAEQISRQADVLNQAVQAASNVMEETLASVDVDNPEGINLSELPMVPDSNGQMVSILEKYSTDDFSIELERQLEGDLLTLTVIATDPDDGTVLYSLKGAKALGKGGIS